MADTALVVIVPEAEPYVGALRERYDPAAAVGVPAHVTVLFPFVPFEQLSRDVLRRIDLISASTRPFNFHLGAFARFPDCFYLKPEPAQPFIDLTLRVVAEFPAYPPYREQLFIHSWTDVSESARRFGYGRLIGDPQLLAYGAQDLRVPIDHGRRFRSAVAKTNSEVEWIAYGDEGHGWNKVETRVDFWGRVEKFLQRNFAAKGQ